MFLFFYVFNFVCSICVYDPWRQAQTDGAHSNCAFTVQSHSHILDMYDMYTIPYGLISPPPNLE